MTNGLILLLFTLSIILFFWGIYKAIQTQKLFYMLALLPFVLLMLGMFLL